MPEEHLSSVGKSAFGPLLRILTGTPGSHLSFELGEDHQNLRYALLLEKGGVDLGLVADEVWLVDLSEFEDGRKVVHGTGTGR